VSASWEGFGFKSFDRGYCLFWPVCVDASRLRAEVTSQFMDYEQVGS